MQNEYDKLDEFNKHISNFIDNGLIEEGLRLTYDFYNNLQDKGLLFNIRSIAIGVIVEHHLKEAITLIGYHLDDQQKARALSAIYKYFLEIDASNSLVLSKLSEHFSSTKHLFICALIKKNQVDKALEVARSIPLAERFDLVNASCYTLAKTGYLEEACKIMVILCEEQLEPHYSSRSIQIDKCLHINNLFKAYHQQCDSEGLIKLLPLVKENPTEKSSLSLAVNLSNVEEVLVKKLAQEGKTQEAISLAKTAKSNVCREINLREIAKILILKNKDNLVINHKTPLFIIKEYLGIELTRRDKINKLFYQLFIELPSFIMQSLKKGYFKFTNTLFRRKIYSFIG